MKAKSEAGKPPRQSESPRSFRYTGGIFRKAYKKNDLDAEDIYEVLERCNSKKCGDKLEKLWISGAAKNKPPSIYELIWQGYGRKYLLWGCAEMTWVIFKIIMEPDSVSKLVSYFNPGQTELTKFDAYYYAALILFLNIANSIFYHNYDLILLLIGFEMKAAFSSLLYRKSLKLTPESLAEVTVGNLMTLITKDVHMFATQMLFVVNDILVGTVQTCIACYLLYSKIGYLSFIGTGVFLSAIPLQVYIGKYITKLRLETGEKTDERLQVTQEVLSTIKTIKMYTWEQYFKEKINQARRKEMRKTLLGFFLKYLLIVIGILVSKLGFYLLLMSYIWMGYPTDATIVFYILSNFNSLKHFLGYLLPVSIGVVAQAISSLTRIDKVIQLAKYPDRTVTVQSSASVSPLVELKQAFVRIGQKEILSNITFNATSGLTVVTGALGSGKSSLLKAILRDYPLTNGKLFTRGLISYASQDPWLFPSTIRQNIIFGQQFNKDRYQDVIRVCALSYDFSLFDKGDETIVCDRGMNLSKGQQARVNLARAVYKDSEIYLLDDSLSALDPHVRDYIFKECVVKYLKDKTCILVSQTIDHIQRSNNVIVMEKGSIKEIAKDCGNRIHGIHKAASNIDLENDSNDDDTDRKIVETDVTRREIYSEFKKKGKVDIMVYKKYIVFGGGVLLLLLNVILVGLAQGSESYSDKLLTKWVDEKQHVLDMKAAPSLNNNATFSFIDYIKELKDAESQEQSTFNIYTIMMIASTILALTKTYVLLDFCRRASVNIHKAMVENVVSALMSFFDSHFIGNILNRFSRDLLNIDEPLPFALTGCFANIFSLIGIMILIATVNSIFLLYAFIVFCLLLVTGKCYLPAGRSLKRLEAITRSPMIGHLNSTIEGLTTIRSYSAQAILTEEFDKHQDLHTSAQLMSICSMRGFTFFMDALCSLFTVLVVMKFIIFDEGTSAGNVGLALTQIFTLGGTIQGGVRQWTELENLMTSAERVLEYTQIKTEPQGGRTIKQWPKNGAVEFDNVSLAYNSKEIVLKNLTFDVAPLQKIGIVGRTGAGKSSIVSTLFRLYEIDGKVLIDDVDINTLSLKFLRGKIGIIPQDPILFSGTIRSNLDPFGDFTDRELWNVLMRVGLDICANLDTQVAIDGSTFSSGQKQLICLARAMLRSTRILILDEASANIDRDTEIVLEKIIEENFSKCTIFKIAHRIPSILRCDKVLVLDAGELKEFDSPLALLENKNGLFYNMVNQAGLLDHIAL
nr:probable multidrug resistance-associated protein lethal(2)03659 [Leptinotarsa decemlineata]